MATDCKECDRLRALVAQREAQMRACIEQWYTQAARLEEGPRADNYARGAANSLDRCAYELEQLLPVKATP